MRGELKPGIVPLEATIVVPAFGSFVFGAALHGATTENSEIANWLVEDWKRGLSLPMSVAEKLVRRVSGLASGITLEQSRAALERRPRGATEASLGLFLILLEANASELAIAGLSLVMGVTHNVQGLSALSAYRQHRIGRSAKPDQAVGKLVVDIYRQLPNWVQAWGRGEHHLTFAG
jgi:hypothetical protein